MRIRTLAIVVLAVVPIAAACGDDGGKDTSVEAKTFCAVVAPVQALTGVSDKADDAKAVQAVFTAAESAFATLGNTPPADLKADLDTVKKTFTDANTALKANGYSYDKAAATNAKALEALDDPAFTKATDNVQAWSTKNCK